MCSRTNICNSTANEAMAPFELSVLNDSGVERCEEGFGPLSLYCSVFDRCRFLIPSAVPVGQECLQLCFSLSLMFYHLFYFQFHPFAGLDTQVRAPCIYAALVLSTGKACGCLLRIPPEEGFPELGMERGVGESAPVLLPPAVYGGRAGQPRSPSQLPRSWGRATDLRFWSKANSHLPLFSEAYSF